MVRVLLRRVDDLWLAARLAAVALALEKERLREGDAPTDRTDDE